MGGSKGTAVRVFLGGCIESALSLGKYVDEKVQSGHTH